MFTHVQALNLVDTLRPNDPIPFIANFMLNNKKYMKNLDEFINELPKNEEGERSRDISIIEGEQHQTINVEDENLDREMNN